MASFQGWFEANWFNFVQTVSIVFGLLFTGFALRRDARSRRVSNLLVLKEEHRELWNIIHENPEFARILKREVDLVAAPMTDQEEIFLRQMIAHFSVAWELMQEGTPLNLDAFRQDAKDTFTLPLPRLAWERAANFQSPKFLRFIKEAIREGTEK